MSETPQIFENVTVDIIDGEVVVKTRETTGARAKDIVSVNAVRLANSLSEIQEARGDRSLDDYIRSLPAEELLALRSKEDITFENENTLVVPHGNARQIAADGKSALIVSSLDQNTLSLNFLKEAKGRDLKNFFNALAEGMDEAGLSLDNAFLVMHFRLEDKTNTASPQVYAHSHTTDDAHINPEIVEGRYYVPAPKRALKQDDLGEAQDFAISRVSEELAESKGHHVMHLTRSWADMIRNGSEEEWEAWRDAIIDHESLPDYAEKGGLRVVLENGVMNFHGGETLYQGDVETAWSKAPQFS